MRGVLDADEITAVLTGCCHSPGAGPRPCLPDMLRLGASRSP